MHIKKNAFKGILLWMIILSVLLFMMSVDSLSLIGIILWIAINIVLVLIGKYALTIKDIYYLSGARFIDKVLSSHLHI